MIDRRSKVEGQRWGAPPTIYPPQLPQQARVRLKPRPSMRFWLAVAILSLITLVVAAVYPLFAPDPMTQPCVARGLLWSNDVCPSTDAPWSPRP